MGSEVSLISDDLVRHLKLRRESSSIPIIGIGGASSGQTRGMIFCTLHSIHTKEYSTVKAYIFPKLMPVLPSFSLSHLHWSHLQGLTLADPDYTSPGSIDFILGADVYGQYIRPQIKRGTPEAPIALNTIFGWAVLEPVTDSHVSAGLVHHVAVDHGFQKLQELLMQFWVQEEVPVQAGSQLTLDEQECESHFVSTHSRDSTGRYVIRLPVKSLSVKLGESYITAAACLQRLQRKLSRDQAYRELCNSFLDEYETLHHMVRAASNSVSRDQAYYLPHHGVLKESSITTKLRVVFNGPSNTTSGVSLNDILHTGAKLQRDISDVLLWVRRHRFVFATDITKMFRQIWVHRDDWDLQRILWVDDLGNIVPYQLTTVAYGTRRALFLAVRVLLQLAADEGEKYPKAVAPLTMGRYVDDIYGGANQLSDLIEQAHQLIGICTAGGFPLAKWQSNHQGLLHQLGVSSSTEASRSIDECETKVLGLSWLPNTDVFKFTTLPFTAGTGITKRVILSEIAQLYDPLGFLSPVIIRAKILLQRLWLEKLSWDDPVSTEVRNSWVDVRQELIHLGNITVPRWINITSGASVEIHGFSDASQLAMGAVVYVRVTSPGNTTKISMVCSKTRVAPIKRHTIPRLELAAALLLAKLTHYVQKTLGLENSPVYLWTDSMVTLTWVSNHPSRWKDFVRNRVSSVQELLPRAQWRFISGRDNPADCASRGLTTLQLERFQLWWVGPQWLAKDSSHWPTHCIGTDGSAALEERPGLTFTVSTKPSPIFNLIHKYSSLTRLLRITSLLFKALTNLKRTGHGSNGTLISPGDLENSRLYWVKAIQGSYFSSELKILASGQFLPKSHPITRLTGFIDFQGIVRVGGRLKHSALQRESKYSVILPRASPLTDLLIADAHQRTFHGGTQVTLAYLRRSCWIIGGRAPTPSSLHSAVSPGDEVSASSAGLSDCGTNFQGADAELQKLFKAGTRESAHLNGLLANDGTKSVFNPPGAPHMGDKWESAVKSVKHYLRRTLGETSLTFEELTTLLTQIEAVLNSRPSEPLSDDPDDLSALTPGHFLIGEALTAIPEPSLREIKSARLSRWQFIQERLQHFWDHWSSGYLQQQQVISKWHHPSHQLRVGSMVLLTNENLPPIKWPLARVIELHPGQDGLTRVVTIKTATSTFKRPVAKLAILPVHQPESSIDSSAAVAATLEHGSKFMRCRRCRHLPGYKFSGIIVMRVIDLHRSP